MIPRVQHILKNYLHRVILLILCVVECQVELANLLNVGVLVDFARDRALSGLVLSPHFHCCRFELLAPLDNATETVCSNGLIGVERDHICCAAQCGTCGGDGCRDRPGGPVRWCLVVLVAPTVVKRI